MTGDRGRGTMTVNGNKIPLGVYYPPFPKSKIDVALAWWRCRHGKAVVPAQVVIAIVRKFED